MDTNILVINQLSQIGAALVAGVLGGLAFDIYQRLCYAGGKKRVKAKDYLKGDIIFCLALVAFLLVFWFTLTNGSLRWSVFMWLGLGAAFYLCLFRHKLDNFFARMKLHKKPKKEKEPQKERKKKRSPQLDVVGQGALLLAKGYKQAQKMSAKTEKTTTAIKEKVHKLLPKRKKKEEDL